MAFKYKVFLIISPLIFIIDQATKNLVRSKMHFGDRIAVIPGYLDIVHTANTGAAFGIFSGSGSFLKNPFFYVVAGIALVFICIYMVRLDKGDRVMPIILSLVVGGIFGNIVDRIRFGAVTDFISLHIRGDVFDKVVFGWHVRFPLEWPAFNVADSAITVAMVLLVISVFFTGGLREDI